MAAHGGVDGGRSHGGGGADDSRGRPTAAEQVVVEPKAESQRSGVSPRIRRAKAEQVALAPEAEMEPEGRRSLTELEGWRDEG
ncbi:hypothetical protein QQF64_031554 [Cirrhinus molitorella]|uniref:Uncharacterized protein n=1 Tax=Cirrhinus molitorella TaxID=172907 RepID=A0ABR3MXC9_9TELE